MPSRLPLVVLTLRADSTAPAQAREAVSRAIADVGVDPHPMKLAVSEAVTNAVVHAYRDAAECGQVRVLADLDGDTINVVVADDGAGMAPRAGSRSLRIGLPTIAMTTDRFAIDSAAGGTHVLMSFDVRPQGSATG